MNESPLLRTVVTGPSVESIRVKQTPPGTAWQRRLAGWIVGRSFPLLGLLLAGTAALAWPLRTLRVSSHERAEIPQDNPDLMLLEDLTQRFGFSEILMVIVQTEDVFTAQGLECLGALTRELGQVPDVRAVLSLSNATELRAWGGGMETAPFLEGTTGAAAPAEKKRRALSNPLWVGNLISRDGTTAAINLMLHPLVEERMARNRVVAQVREILERHRRPGIELYLTGLSSLVHDSIVYVRRDTLVFCLAAPPIISLILWILYRTLTAVAAPLILIPVVTVWTLGPLALAGRELNPILTVLPTLVSVGFLSNLVHLLGEYYRQAKATRDRREALEMMLTNMMGPCFMAAATTVVGYASLMTASLASVIALGFWGCVGLVVAYALAMLMLPGVLRLFPLPLTVNPGLEAVPTRMDRAIGWMADRLTGRGWTAIVAVSCLLAVGSVAGMKRLRVETDLSKDLPATAPSVRGLRVAEGKLSGILTLEICLEGEKGTFRQGWAMAALDGLHRYVAALRGVDQVTSLAQLVGLLHASLAGGTGERLPGSDAALWGYLGLLGASKFAPFVRTMVTGDYSAALVSARVGTLSTKETDALLEKVDEYAKTALDKRLKARTTGVIKLISAQVGALVDSQFSTLELSLGAIVLVIVVYLRRLKMGLMCLPPNALAILLTLGLMGVAGIPLNMSTVMTSALAFGMIVDNTIHVVVRYRRFLRAGAEPEEAAKRAILQAGKAMICASLSITAGFVILGLSAFVPVREFGLLIGFTILTALVADLIMTPALLMRYRPR